MSHEQVERAAWLAEQVRQTKEALAALSRPVADAEELLAATYERMADEAPDRAEELLANAAAARQYAEIKRWRCARYARSARQGE